MNLKVFIFLLALGLSLKAQVPTSAYVVNTIGESLTAVNLDNQTVYGTSIPLGLYANTIDIRNQRAYSVISGSNEIHVLDLVTRSQLGRIQLPAGSNPYDIDFVNDSIAVVTLLNFNQVSFVNVFTGAIVRSVPAGVAPQGIRYHNGHVYAANSGFNGGGYDPGIVTIISTADYTTENISVGLNPQSLDFDSQGNLVVACSGNYTTVPAQLDIIAHGSSTVTFSQTLPVPVTNVFIGGSDRAFLATYTEGVMVYDLSGRTFIRDSGSSLKGGPGVAFDAQNNIYICHFDSDSLYVYSPDFQRINGYLVGDGPVSVALYDPLSVGIETAGMYIFKNYAIYPNYPNPFNPSTTIRIEIFRTTEIRVDIININGQHIRRLLTERLPSGIYSVSWDGNDQQGVPVSSGIYLVRFRGSENQKIQKIQLLR